MTSPTTIACACSPCCCAACACPSCDSRVAATARGDAARCRSGDACGCDVCSCAGVA